MKITDYKQIIILLKAGKSRRDIAAICHVSPQSITKCKRYLSEHPLSLWELENLSEEELRTAISPVKKYVTKKQQSQPEAYLVEIVKNQLTYKEAWEKYKNDAVASGTEWVHYSHFLRLLHHFDEETRLTADKSFIPGALYERWVRITDAFADEDGVLHPAYLFFAFFPYSQFMVCKCFTERNTYNWLRGNVGLIEQHSCIPITLISEPSTSTHQTINGLKQIRPEFHDFIETYKISYNYEIHSTEVKKEVENAINELKCAIDAPYYSFGDLCSSIARFTSKYNTSPIPSKSNRKLAFQEFEKKLTYCNDLPPFRPYIEEQKTVLVNCHISYKNKMYSVPYQYVGTTVQLHIFDSSIGIYTNPSTCIATHPILKEFEGRYCTKKEHLPTEQDEWRLEWNRNRFLKWSEKIGEDTKEFILKLMSKYQYPQQAYLSCYNILSRSAAMGKEAVNDACRRALITKHISSSFVLALLK